MGGTREGGLKQAQKYLAKDPDYYKKLAAKAREARGNKPSPGSFKKGTEATRAAARLGAAKSAAVRRAKALKKRHAVSDGKGGKNGKRRGAEA